MKAIFRSRFLGALALAWAFTTTTAQGGALIFDSDIPADNATVRLSWLAAIGIAAPRYLEDMESGFTNGQNVSGVSGLFAGGLVITDTSTAHKVLVTQGNNSIGGADPVGTTALAHNEKAYLELDFSAQPVDYVGLLDIDHTVTQEVVITFVGGGKQTTDFEGANEAEFVGIYRNDMPRITLVQIDVTGDGEWGIDNIEYGQPVPEPESWLLMLAGMALVIGTGRRSIRGGHPAVVA